MGSEEARPRRPRTKRRTANQIQGKRAEDLVSEKFPAEWLVRKIDADFGLDLHVEAFDYSDAKKESVDTLGEHLFVQVKSVRSIKARTLTIHERRNVSKYAVSEPAGKSYDIQVYPYSLEVSEIATIEAMGNAIPVLLCVTAMDTQETYYLCMNDYISKCLVPSNPNFHDQKTLTVYIPSWNVLDVSCPGFSYLRLLARRAKLYSAFNTFNYQYHELTYLDSEIDGVAQEADRWEVKYPVPEEVLSIVRVFLSGNLRLDIWDSRGAGYWYVLVDLHRRFQHLANSLDKYRIPMGSYELFQARIEICEPFRLAANAGNIYEELVREWRLPTVLATHTDDHPSLRYRPPSLGSE